VFGRKLKEAPVASLKFERVEQVLEHYEPQIPEEVYRDLRERVQEATTAATTSQKVALKQMGLLAPLATAGISALAYQHELRKQFSTIESIIERIAEVRTSDANLRRSLASLREDLSSWLERARATNALFGYLADAENIETKRRFRAAAVVEEVKKQMEFLARGIEVDTSKVDERLLLPEASLAEWSAIFQNVFTNAFNAMMDSEERFLQLSSRARGKSREILVQDTGLGVDLRDADRLFEPFERGVKISRERRALGYGGTGLGLTIVRLLADMIGCKVGFVEPDEGFSTAFSLSWRETQ
jgi:signal transduction histidine kinase